MAGISNTVKLNIIRDHLAHFSNEEAAIRNHVSKGTVDNVLKEFRAGLIPGTANLVEDAEVTREIAASLKKLDLKLGDAHIGLNVLAQCRQYGLDPADMNRWGIILKAAEDEAGAEAFVRDVYRVLDILDDSGLPLKGLKDTVESLNAQRLELESVEEQYGEAVEKTEQLTKQRDELGRQVSGLKEKYALIAGHIKELERFEQAASHRLTESKVAGDHAKNCIAALDREKESLSQKGLTPDDIAELNDHLSAIARRRGKAASGIKERLYRTLESLDVLIDLEEQVRACKQDLDKVKETAAGTKQEHELLIAAIATDKREKKALEENIDHLRQTVTHYWTDLATQAKSLTAEALRWLNDRLNEEMGIVKLITERALVAGNNAGQMEGYFKAKEWFQNVPELIKGDKQIDKLKVAQIVIAILDGFAQWLKQNQTDQNNYSSLNQAVTDLCQEVQKRFYYTITWQVGKGIVLP